ncbi:MAG: universal stress protein [Lentilitoribacter sp.]
MKKDTILTFVGTSTPTETIDKAIRMADDANAHLSVVILAVAPQLYAYGYGIAYGRFVGVENWSQEIKDMTDDINAKSDQIEKLVQEAGISADVLMEFCESSLLRNAVMSHACLADRVVILDHSGLPADILDGVMSGVIFDAPSGLIHGRNAEKAAVSSQNAFIAWDSSKHCAAAIKCALPLFDDGTEVTIGVFDPIKRENEDGEEPGADLASWLSRHDVKVTIEQYPSGGEEIADCIIKRAKEKGADLVVMGGYGHMKIRQQLFGGTTETMLNQRELPILMAHK